MSSASNRKPPSLISRHRYYRSAERCGFRWHFHQLRHTFACRYLEAGGTPAALKEILGHSTIRLTERYSRLSEPAVFADARRVDLGTPGVTKAVTKLERRSAKSLGRNELG